MSPIFWPFLGTLPPSILSGLVFCPPTTGADLTGAYDMITGDLVYTVTGGILDFYQGLCISPDTTRLVTTDATNLYISDVTTGDLLATLPVVSDNILYVGWADNHTLIVSITWEYVYELIAMSDVGVQLWANSTWAVYPSQVYGVPYPDGNGYVWTNSGSQMLALSMVDGTVATSIGCPSGIRIIGPAAKVGSSIYFLGADNLHDEVVVFKIDIASRTLTSTTTTGGVYMFNHLTAQADTLWSEGRILPYPYTDFVYSIDAVTGAVGAIPGPDYTPCPIVGSTEYVGLITGNSFYSLKLDTLVETNIPLVGVGSGCYITGACVYPVPSVIHVGIAMWSVSGTPTICGYDLDSNEQIWVNPFTGFVQDGFTGAAFSSDRTKLAVVSGGYSEVYLLNTGSGIADDSATISVEGDNPFALAVIANDDTFVTCGASDPTCPVSAYTFGNSTPLWTNTITHGFLPACTQTEVWVIDSETHTLEIYSLADGSALGSLSVPGTVEEYSNIVFHNGKAYFFTLESGTSFNLYTIDVATHTIDSVVTMDNTVPTETVLLNQDGQLWIWQNVGSPVFRASQIDLSSETIVIESPTSSLWPVGFAGSSTSVGAMDYSDYTEGHTWVASVDNATGTVSRFAVGLQHLPGGNSGSLQAMYDLTI